MKEERILKKVDKLLKLYGVEDEEREKFLLDLKDKKYDDQEEVEETVEEEELPAEENGEELPAENEVAEEGEEQVGGEELPEEQEEEIGEDVQEDAGELPVDQPQEEQPLPQEGLEPEQPLEQEQPPMEQPVEDNAEETAKTIEGLMARIQALEEIVEKLGTPVNDDIGVNPNNPSAEGLEESEFDQYNRLRRGR